MSQRGDAHGRITEILRELERAIATDGAADVFERYTAPEYVFTSPAGRVMGRSEVLAGLRDRSVAFSSYRMDDIDIRQYGNVAVVLGRAQGDGVNPGGERFIGAYRFTSVWSQLDGLWKLLAWQATAVAPADAATADATV